MDRELLRTGIGLFSEVALPVFFLRAWLDPGATLDDTTASLMVVLAGEGLVLIVMVSPLATWKLSDFLTWASYAALVLLVAIAAFTHHWTATGVAALLLLGRGTGVVFGRGSDPDTFPATEAQTWAALALFSAIGGMLGLAGEFGIHVSSNNKGDMAAHGTLYFSAILAVRIFLLTRKMRLRRQQKLAYRAAFGDDP